MKIETMGNGRKYIEVSAKELTDLLVEKARSLGLWSDGLSPDDFELDCEVVGHWQYLQSVTLLEKEKAK